MWRTHKNRVDKGLGPTWSGTGHHKSMIQDFNMIMPNCSYSVNSLIEGRATDYHYDNPFLRWHKVYEEYDAFLSDIDDIAFTETDEYERLKKYRALEKNTVGDGPTIPRKDDDEAFEFYDI